MIPAASSAPNVSGRAERRPDAQVARRATNSTITSPAAEQPELLADDREDEVVAGVGQEQPAGEPALARGPAPKMPPSPSASRPWTCGSRCRAGPPTGRARRGSGPAGSRAGRRACTIRDARPRPGTPRWTRFAPARKNIVNAVSASTDVVPRSGSAARATTTGTMITRNGTVPAQKPRTPPAPLREPVGEVDDQRELRELGRVDRRQRPDLEPAGRAADHDVELGHEHEDQAGRARSTNSGHRRPAAASGSRSASSRPSRRMPSARPVDLRADDRERVVALEVGLHRRRRVDHQDADRGEGDDRDQDPVLGLVALALERDLGRARVRGDPRCGRADADARSPASCSSARPPRPGGRRPALNARPRAA